MEEIRDHKGRGRAHQINKDIIKVTQVDLPHRDSRLTQKEHDYIEIIKLCEEHQIERGRGIIRLSELDIDSIFMYFHSI